MNKNNIFKIIVKAYYENHFEEVINNLLDDNETNKEEMKNILAALCGVEINPSNKSYAEELKKAIENYNSSNKIVTKIKPCSMECTISEGKISCIDICPFDAVIVDEEKHTTFIDNDKCTDCGFCVDACPMNCYMDKVQFIPLANSL